LVSQQSRASCFGLRRDRVPFLGWYAPVRPTYGGAAKEESRNLN
jgi:hypothetical protein